MLRLLEGFTYLSFALLLHGVQIRPTAAFQPVARPTARQARPDSSSSGLSRGTWPARLSQRPVRSSPLCSLNRLVEDAFNPSRTTPRVIFVGGKGGVGKTTVSSALAVHLASTNVNAKILVVSTDPAHSLGDALDVDLKGGEPIVLTDPVTGGRLSACEVDAGAALADFRERVSGFDVTRLADSLGVPPSLLDSLGLNEFSGLLNNPPPGLDELVALSKVLDPETTSEYDVIVVDTAPTGHTLRLLALPKFLDGFLGKLINIRIKLSGVASTLQGFFGNEQAQERKAAIDTAVERLEAFRNQMMQLQSRLRNPDDTGFVVVTVPTQLGVAESQRLVRDLGQQGVRVTDIVINQCVGGIDTGDSESLQKYYERRQQGQAKWVGRLTEAVEQVSESEEYQSNGPATTIHVSKVPFFDVELVGIPALAYVGLQVYNDNPNFAHLFQDSSSGEPKVVICGGKGGVGKTTTSSSLAVNMASRGHKVALISTDPAHSLGDAIGLDLRGGKLMDCPLIGVPATEGSLSVLEVDPADALNEFKGIVDQLVGGGNEMGGENAGLANTMRELQEVFDTLPAGTDEVVALSKIVNLVKKGGFDRIVLDTAPTGHTLRMLSTPSFLAELIERLLKISDKINNNAAVRMFISSQARSQDWEAASTQARSTLLNFQFQMYDLEDLFANAEQTEFLVVTVPTELAVRESMRLLNDLTFESPDLPIKVRNIVVNQVLSDGNAQVFLDHLSTSQRKSVDALERTVDGIADKPVLTLVSYLDTEPRGVFGLKVLADALLQEEKVES